MSLVRRYTRCRYRLRINRVYVVTWAKEARIVIVPLVFIRALYPVVRLSRQYWDVLELLLNIRLTLKRLRQRRFKVLSWEKEDNRWDLRQTRRPLKFVILPWVLCLPFSYFITIPTLLKTRFSRHLIRKMQIYRYELARNRQLKVVRELPLLERLK